MSSSRATSLIDSLQILHVPSADAPVEYIFNVVAWFREALQAAEQKSIQIKEKATASLAANQAKLDANQAMLKNVREETKQLEEKRSRLNVLETKFFDAIKALCSDSRTFVNITRIAECCGCRSADVRTLAHEMLSLREPLQRLSALPAPANLDQSALWSELDALIKARDAKVMELETLVRLCDDAARVEREAAASEDELIGAQKELARLTQIVANQSESLASKVKTLSQAVTGIEKELSGLL